MCLEVLVFFPPFFLHFKNKSLEPCSITSPFMINKTSLFHFALFYFLFCSLLFCFFVKNVNWGYASRPQEGDQAATQEALRYRAAPPLSIALELFI